MNSSEADLEIVNSYLALNALRQVGYRSTATALAELVDNSIEAEANDIYIITFSRKVKGKQRATYQVQKICVLDNGTGMRDEDFARCLSLGWGTRLEGRAGLGRFGFGLKGASISQCRHIDIFTWDEKRCLQTFMDLDDIKEQEKQTLEPVRTVPKPAFVTKYFGSEFASSGTLVEWSKLDSVDFKRPSTLLGRLEGELCRLYRHFLDDDDTYGRRRNVKLVDIDMDADKITSETILKANDPLYLLSPSNAPDSDGKATNEVFEKPYKIPVEYAEGKFSDVEVRLSIAKPEVQGQHGGSKLGQHYKKNAGISFVRAGREIDFGDFGFLTANDGRHRWWGAEVRFDPALDEVFGVTNNKQSIRGFEKVDDDLREHLAETAKDQDSAGRFRAKMQLDLSTNLTDQIKTMMSVITARGSKKQENTATLDKVNKGVNKKIIKDNTPTSSEVEAQGKSDAVKKRENLDLLSKKYPGASPEDLERLSAETIDDRVSLDKSSWPGNTFLDIQTVANAAVGKINTQHEFYDKFWKKLEDNADPMGLNALEVSMLAFVRTEDEFRKEHSPKIFNSFRDRWGYWVNQLMEEID